MTELKQTKSSFKLIGFATRLDKDGAFKEEVAQKGKREGENFRALRFGIKTSDTNEITVSTFDYEPEQVFMWNSDKKKADKEYKGERIPFETWEEQQDELREQGYAVLQSRVGLTYGGDGKIISKGLPSYVASREIYNNLDNGDAVVVEGETRFSTYEKQGKIIEQKTHTIKKIFKLKELDFADAGYEEITFFEQEMVFVDADHDKQEGKVYVTGRVIDFMKNFHDTQMIVRYKDEEGNVDKGMEKLAKAMSSKFKFGDLITVYGDILNRVVLKEVEEDDDEDDLFASFGGKQKPKKAQTFTARTYISEMSIYGIEGYEEKVYEEDDFTKDELMEKKESKKDSTSEFGGKAKKSNPFETDSDDDDDDDLPF